MLLEKQIRSRRDREQRGKLAGKATPTRAQFNRSWVTLQSKLCHWEGFPGQRKPHTHRPEVKIGQRIAWLRQNVGTKRRK